MPANPQTRLLVEEWVGKQRADRPLLASEIVRALADRADPVEIADVLVSLALNGALSRVFAVRVPAGPVLKKVYSSLDQIEVEVRDPLGRAVSRDDLEILPAFIRARGRINPA